MAKSKNKIKEDLVKLDMTFEISYEKRALNTALPGSETKFLKKKINK